MKWATGLVFVNVGNALFLAHVWAPCYLAAVILKGNAMRRNPIVSVIIGLASCSLIVSVAEADVLAGTLKCRVSGGPSLVVVSQHNVKCLYRSNAQGIRQYYLGTSDRVGLALGFRFAGTLLWDVRSSLHDVRALDGEYAGVGGDAEFFDGPSGDMLVGGEGGRITLKPVTVGGPSGFEVGAGIGRLSLTRTNRSELFEGLDDDDLD